MGGETRLVIIVTFRSQDSIDPLFATVLSWLRTCLNGHLVLVENGGDGDLIRDLYNSVEDELSERVCLLLNDVNSGFAPAVNLALAFARQRWTKPATVLLLNPDIETDPETMTAVIEAAENVGVAAPLLLSQTGEPDGGSMRNAWTAWSLFCLGAGLHKRQAWPFRSSGQGDGVELAETELIDVAMTSGAYMAIVSPVLGDGLDVTLPMYLEDQEICIRARNLGYRVVVTRGWKAVHVGGLSSRSLKKPNRSLRQMELAEAPYLAYCYEHPGGRRLARVALGAGGVTRAALVLVSTPIMLIKGRSGRTWLGRQLRLALWIAGWAISRPTSFDLPRGEYSPSAS